MSAYAFVPRGICFGLACVLSSLPTVSRATTAQLSPEQIVTLAEQFLGQGRLNDAAVLLDSLAGQNDGGPQRVFLQGLLALERKQYREAARFFREVLRDRPDSPRVRLELARTLFLAAKWSAADYQFRLADVKNLPPTTHRIINSFRQRIREQRRWTATLELGLAPDTNVNQGSESDIAIIYGRPFQLSDDARRRSGVGLTGSTSGEFRFLRRPGSAIVVSGFANFVEYDGPLFDDYLVGGAVGRQQDLGQGRLTVSATGFHRWYGQRPYAIGYGIRAQYGAPVGKWQRTMQVAVQRITYPRSPVQTGLSLSATLGVGHSLTASSAATAQLSVTRQQARDAGYAFIDGGLNLAYYRELPVGLSMAVDLSVDRTIYDAAITAYGPAARRQWRGRTSISLAKRDWLFAGFAPAVKVTQALQRSNISLFDFARRRIELTVTRPL
ncbi:surface lipoprotein assembly modifier [Sphingomonas sp.]|uniref:surface lipoprotein assembly modifier n=1 Tax=Sphingomonas sp. TaxID=28214 RepID=UPI0025D966B5|nr:surface lipoprotein assembly modifier [Sphingomonas sp.]